MNPNIKIHYLHGQWVARHLLYPVTVRGRKRDEVIAACLLKAEGTVPLPSFAELHYEPRADAWVCSHKQFPRLVVCRPDRDQAITDLIKVSHSAGAVTIEGHSV